MMMLKEFSKYLVIAVVNSTILAALLLFWTDKLELTFNESVRVTELLKIIGLTVFLLIGMRVLVYYFRKRNIDTLRTKIKWTILLTLLMSSYLYIDYSIRVVNNVIVNRHLRAETFNKVKPAKGLAYGTMADSLTLEEYNEIAQINRFPEIPSEAINISFVYEYDDFLPDYSFSLTYDLPMNIKADTIDFNKGDFSKHQTVEIKDNRKRVVYTEFEQ